MKKYISIILAVVLSICGLSACGQADSNQTTDQGCDNHFPGI